MLVDVRKTKEREVVERGDVDEDEGVHCRGWCVVWGLVCFDFD